MDIYANPELYEMFNLYLESINGSRHENMRESQAMEFLTNLMVTRQGFNGGLLEDAKQQLEDSIVTFLGQ